MISSKKLFCLASTLAILATPLVDAAAQTRTRHRYPEYSQYGPVPSGYWNYGGEYGYGDYGYGWRNRSNTRGWDNTCINAPWLPSQFACSPK